MDNLRKNKIPCTVWLENYELNSLNEKLEKETTQENLEVIGDIIKTAKGRGDFEIR